VNFNQHCVYFIYNLQLHNADQICCTESQDLLERILRSKLWDQNLDVHGFEGLSVIFCEIKVKGDNYNDLCKVFNVNIVT